MPSSLLEDRAVEIENQARRHIEDVHERMARSYFDLNHWKAEGYKSACQMLDPIIVWFARRLKENPTLSTRKTFTELRTMALTRVSTLCSVDIGTVMAEGIIEKKLGTGLFGTVWKLEGKIRATALKIYHPQDLHNDEKGSRFRRGYEAMRQMDHPHIVRVHNFTECPLAFSMDFIDGPNLRNFVGTIEDPGSLIDILFTVAETLRHAHDRKVVHRDVKPENILMSFDEHTEQWRPFLTDFDLAWYSTATQVTRIGKEVIGTWQYSAPEQLSNPRSDSAHAPTTDSYSFAQLMFYVMTGSDPLPLNTESNEKTLSGRLHIGWIRKPADMFLELYHRCSSHNPDLRPSFDHICDSLFQIGRLLKDIGEGAVLDESKFIEDLIFSIIGISPEYKIGANGLLSLSRKTRVELSIQTRQRTTLDILYIFRSQISPIVNGASGFQQMRRLLMGKISNSLADIEHIIIKPGTEMPFQVIVNQQSLPLTLEGMTIARSLISRVLKCIEHV